MTPMPALALALALAALGAGCASTNDTTTPAGTTAPSTTEVLGGREYRTGSNIPHKEIVPARSAEPKAAASQPAN